jgi:hypothetical protein
VGLEERKEGRKKVRKEITKQLGCPSEKYLIL